MQLVTKGVCDVILSPLNDQTGCCIDNRLKRTQTYRTRLAKDTITINHAADDETWANVFADSIVRARRTVRS